MFPCRLVVLIKLIDPVLKTEVAVDLKLAAACSITGATIPMSSLSKCVFHEFAVQTEVSSSSHLVYYIINTGQMRTLSPKQICQTT